MKHTPGAWEVKIVEGNNHDEVYASIQPGVAFVGKIGVYKKKLSMEAKANAYLIAAAPELLEALKRAVQIMKDDDYFPQEYEGFEQAIARAEGAK